MANGLQSGLTAETIFNVIASVVTTTTTTSADTTTTTITSETTTTAAGSDETTTTITSETTTTTEKEVSGVVTEFSVEPGAATLGSQIEVEGVLTHKLAKVQLWLDDQRLGTPLTVEKDGSFQATRKIPDVAPGTYRLRLKTPNGQVLATRTFRVLAADEDTTTTVPKEGGDSDLGELLATPIAVAIALGMLLAAAIAVWWMWRSPTDEETNTQEPPTEGSAESGSEDGDAD